MNPYLQRLLAKLAAAHAQSESYCVCGAPYSQHTYWEDRIYDYNGYRCPQSPGGDFRHDVQLTGYHRQEAQAAVLRDALNDQLVAVNAALDGTGLSMARMDGDELRYMVVKLTTLTP